jgi:hypothetical protein
LAPLTKIKETLILKCLVSPNPKILQNKTGLYKFSFSRQSDVLKIVDWLYGGANNYLDRKYAIAMTAKQFAENTRSDINLHKTLNVDRETLQKMYDRLGTHKLIANELGYSTYTIGRWMKKFGIISIHGWRQGRLRNINE